jgi:hypothetical protein
MTSRIASIIVALALSAQAPEQRYDFGLDEGLGRLTGELAKIHKEVRYSYRAINVPGLEESLQTRIYLVNFETLAGYQVEEKLLALRNGKLQEFGAAFGGHGLMSALVHNGCMYYSFSWGSGLHRSHVGRLKVVGGDIDVWESDWFPNADVIVKKERDRVEIVQGAYAGFNRINSAAVVGEMDSIIPYEKACRSEG